MRLKLISCGVFHREVCDALRRCPHDVHPEFLPMGLHDLGAAGMRPWIQDTIDRVPENSYHAILLAYALCGNAFDGVMARHTPLVLPRAHDCITLFLGAAERYLHYIQQNPGTFFRTSGWIERRSAPADPAQLPARSDAGPALRAPFGQPSGADWTYEALVGRYGEEDAAFLDEELNRRQHYRKLAFIEMGVEPDDSFELASREEAERRCWEFEKVAGDMSLLQALLNGDWAAERFLVVPPGARVMATFDARIVAAEPES
jgi:hypothetical protein